MLVEGGGRDLSDTRVESGVGLNMGRVRSWIGFP